MLLVDSYINYLLLQQVVEKTNHHPGF